MGRVRRVPQTLNATGSVSARSRLEAVAGNLNVGGLAHCFGRPKDDNQRKLRKYLRGGVDS